MSLDEIRAEIEHIAARLAGAPAQTEDAARRDLAAWEAKHGAMGLGHYPHMAGGLQQVAESAARDLRHLAARLAEVLS